MMRLPRVAGVVAAGALVAVAATGLGWAQAKWEAPAAEKAKKSPVARTPESVAAGKKLLIVADYDKPVTLDVLLRHLGQSFGNPLPPGVTMVDGKSKTLLGTGSRGSIVLKAAPDAADCTDVPVCVQGYVPVNFVVKIGYASEPVLVSVKK